MSEANTCDCCGGSGKRMYGNTSTWRGGGGGQAMTLGICDKCWGSGDASRPWRNLREDLDNHRAANQQIKKLEAQLADLTKVARDVREACYLPGEASKAEQIAVLDKLDTSIMMLPYLKTVEEAIRDAVQECERLAMHIEPPKSIGRQQGRHHAAGAQSAARAIRNHFSGHFEDSFRHAIRRKVNAKTRSKQA